MLDIATRKIYYNRCDPYESLAPDDERNVDLDAVADEKLLVRGRRWSEWLAAKVELSSGPVCEFFTGLPGSGKSTELRRLALLLQQTEGANLLPVLLDAKELIDLNATIDLPDLMAAILYRTEQEVLRAERKDPRAALKDGAVNRLWNWLTKTDLRLQATELSIPPHGNLVLEMKTRETLRERVRAAIASNVSTFLGDVSHELIDLEKRCQRVGRAGLIVIFDSLEKLQGLSSNWREVLDSAEQLFSGGAPRLRLPIHAIYTFPSALVFRCFESPPYLPMIKLRNQAGEPFAPGIDAARRIVRQRVPDEIMSELLGTEFDERIRRIISESGGYPREIIRMMKDLFAAPNFPLSDFAFERILNEVRDGYRLLIPANAFPWLARVATERFLTAETAEQRELADQMLRNNAILRYLNDDTWFDLHPAVMQIPGVWDAIQALKKNLPVRFPG